jgi:hypothetical protein
MLIVLGVCRTEYGKGGDLVTLFREAREEWSVQYAGRILTDASGAFFTFVVETKVESLAEWERRSPEFFANQEFGDWFARMTPLLRCESREFCNVKAWVALGRSSALW